MNILFIDQFPTLGGGQRSMLELLPMVRRRGWRAHVALPGDGVLAECIRGCSIPVDFVPCGSYTPAHKSGADTVRYLREAPRMTRALSRLVAAHRIGFLYVNGPRLLPAAAWVARAHSIPLLFHCHHRIQQPAAARLVQASLRWARGRAIACCKFACEPIGSVRHRVIYNGVAPPAWARSTPDPLRAWTIGVIGRVEQEKGQLEFASAAQMLTREVGRCRFLVAGAPLFSGPAYFEKVKRASRGLPLEFLGWQDDIGTVFAQLDLLVVPSSDIDSTPRVVIEAFSGGVPVVAFPSGGIPEVVEDGVNGFLAARRTPSALAARIRSVLEMSHGARREVAERARAEWRERYTLERFQEEVGDAIVQASS